MVEVAAGARARFVVEIHSPLPPDQLWARLWDLRRHGEAVPLTHVCSDRAELRAGSRFVARTAVGALGFDDRMLVRTWQAPRLAVVDKTGPLLTGTICATVEAAGTGSRLMWQQHFGARGVPDALAALANRPVAAGYARVLRRITG